MGLHGIVRLWEKDSIILLKYDQHTRETNLVMMIEFDTLGRIMAYVDENRIKAALEAEVSHMASKANEIEVFDVSQRVNVKPQPVKELRIAVEDDG